MDGEKHEIVSPQMFYCIILTIYGTKSKFKPQSTGFRMC